MNIKVVKTKFSMLNNAHISLLVIDGDVDLSSASYLMQRLDQGYPLKTIESEAKVIKRFYEFCHIQNIHPATRFSHLERLTIGEIESLTAFYSSREDTGEVVASGTFKLRWSVTRRFIKFIWDFYQSRVKSPDKLKAAQIQLEGMEKAFKIHGKTPYRTANKDKIGLPLDLRAEFLDIINPVQENTKNPWKGELVRWRNYCLFLTMILGGNRKGESLCLKLNHFKLTGSAHIRKYFEIIKEDTMKSGYPRTEIPSIKTKGRQVELSDDLAAIFEYYITKIRPKFKNAPKSNYMFLSLRDGQPLSVVTPNESLKTLVKKHPQFEKILSPHILRNTFHDFLDEKLESTFKNQGPIAKQAIKSSIQEYAGGWSSGSAMVNRYPKGSIQRRVGELHLALQHKILEGVKDGN